MIDISRRQWDDILQRLSRIEGKIRMIEGKLDLFEKKIKPQELYRVVKQREQDEAIASLQQPPQIMPGMGA